MLITLTTDFGYNDAFAGIMKGVIASINPRVQVVDLTHGVPPQDIMAAALVLRHSISYFPYGTIHIVVVDPGVGSARRPLLIEFDGRYLIGPDNGVLSLALERKEPNTAIHLSNPAYHLQPTSATFHGRDIFAPVAGHLSLGISPLAFGGRIEDFVRLTLPPVHKSKGVIEGEVVYIDGFGNLFTNIQENDLRGLAMEFLTISLGQLSAIGVRANYASVREGEELTLINSWGLLEIAVYKGNAGKRTGAKVGDKVEVALPLQPSYKA
jgi:S-adenosylmethionine hydrolase